MNTQILLPTKENIEIAARELNSGEVIGIPTETVYGLAANALNPNAIRKIYSIKGRPNNNPLIVHVSCVEEVYELAYVSSDAQKIIDYFWPGPLTILLKKKNIIPHSVTAGLDTVAIRLPAHPITRSIIAQAHCPLAAPSANISGKPSPTEALHVFDDFNGKIPYIIDGGSCKIGLESTVLDLSKVPYTILRPGGVTLESIQKIFPSVELSQHLFKPITENSVAESPGMLYKHYAPEAEVVLLDGQIENIALYIREAYFCSQKTNKKIKILCFEEHYDYFPKDIRINIGSYHHREKFAERLFRLLRALDKMHVDTIYSEVTSLDGIGMAIMNRLIRAASFRIVNTDIEKYPQSNE